MSKKLKQKSVQNLVVNPRRAISQADSQSASMIRRLTFVTSIAANTGVSHSTTGMNGATEWSSLATRYNEVRCLAMRIQVGAGLPTSGAPPLGVSGALIYAIDRSGALSAPGNAAAAFAMSGARVLNTNATTNRMPVAEALAKDLEDFNFDPVGSLVTKFAIPMFNYSANQALLFIEWIVEFRGVN